MATTTAARKTKPSANGKVKSVTIHGVKFSLPAKPKARLLKYFAKGEGIGGEELLAIVELSLGDEQMERFWEIDVDTEKKGLDGALAELLETSAEKVIEAYGTTLGE